MQRSYFNQVVYNEVINTLALNVKHPSRFDHYVKGKA